MGCGFSKADIIEQIAEPFMAVTGEQPSAVSSSGGQPSAASSSGGESSAVYRELPSGATKAAVRNVYDGDTLTLVDERRVRFLGIDTPEIKEKQEFAQEAKNYTKSHCDKKEIWMTFEPGQDKEDHYGRLLAWVWVRTDTGAYLCVNEGIVSAGLASVYIPSASSKFKTMDKMVAQQKQARQKRLGMWGNFSDYKVITTKNGTAYHVKSCKHLGNSHNVNEINVSEALDAGLHPCRTCQT